MVGVNQCGRKEKFPYELGAERKFFQVGALGVSPLEESGYRLGPVSDEGLVFGQEIRWYRESKFKASVLLKGTGSFFICQKEEEFP